MCSRDFFGLLKRIIRWRALKMNNKIATIVIMFLSFSGLTHANDSLAYKYPINTHPYKLVNLDTPAKGDACVARSATKSSYATFDTLSYVMNKNPSYMAMLHLKTTFPEGYQAGMSLLDLMLKDQQEKDLKQLIKSQDKTNQLLTRLIKDIESKKA